MISVNLLYPDYTEESRSFPENLIPRIGDKIIVYNKVKTKNDCYRVEDVVWDINPVPSDPTQLKCVHIYLKDL